MGGAFASAGEVVAGVEMLEPGAWAMGFGPSPTPGAMGLGPFPTRGAFGRVLGRW